MKFFNDLRPEVKMMVNCHSIHNFAQLTNMCRIFDEDQREKVAFYKNVNARHGKEKKSVTHSRAKPYSAPPGQYGHGFGGQRTSGGLQPVGGSSQPINRMSQPAGRGSGGSGAPAIVTTPLRCGKCDRLGHIARECTDREVTCFNCQGKGHLSTSCPHPRREKRSGSLNNQSERPRITGECLLLVVLMPHSLMISSKVCVS